MNTNLDYGALAEQIKQWGKALGFNQIGITNTDLSNYTPRFQAWLDKKFNGEMDFMSKHGEMRYLPEHLVPGTLRIITARMDYLPPATRRIKTLTTSHKGYISRYALGRDYHKLIRKRLQRLAEQILQVTGPFGFRTFADSAPVLEKPLAEKSGLGWIGKHTNLINHKAGSWFFLGELFTTLPLPMDKPLSSHCGSCQACIQVCPTQAIIAPYQLDARRCISYLTIELKGSIPLELRPLIGNRIYGCDDCQLFCPWNKFARVTNEKDFHPRHHLENTDLIDLFQWSETEFLQKTEGSAIRRIGYSQWLRNIAVGLGNGPATPSAIKALNMKSQHPSAIVREHVQWALQQLQQKMF